MLKKWINEIRTQSNLYKADCWKYHLSGNVIELSILPAYIKQKESYRCSVIAVGQVLNALSKKIEKEHLNFHIQSFPNIENPEIVATIRTDEKNEFTGNSKWKAKKESRDEDVIATIKTLAQRYKLNAYQVENHSTIKLEQVPHNNYTAWLVLTSTFNNPFTWLNLGYLKESLKNELADSSTSKNFCILDFCDSEDNDFPNLQVPENKYIQSLIGIQATNISTG